MALLFQIALPPISEAVVPRSNSPGMSQLHIYCNIFSVIKIANAFSNERYYSQPYRFHAHNVEIYCNFLYSPCRCSWGQTAISMSILSPFASRIGTANKIAVGVADATIIAIHCESIQTKTNDFLFKTFSSNLLNAGMIVSYSILRLLFMVNHLGLVHWYAALISFLHLLPIAFQCFVYLKECGDIIVLASIIAIRQLHIEIRYHLLHPLLLEGMLGS